jgi:lipopolysaccharide transport system permease protein
VRDDRHEKLVIKAGLSAKNYWGDLWRYRELAYFLTWRDVVVRYKQTVIGVAWALLRPALTMVVFVVFRGFVGIGETNVPEPLLVFAGVLPWQLFSTSLTESSGSLLGNANLISKVYFPRLIIPWSAVVTAVVDFLIALGLLAALMVAYGFVPGWQIVALPLFLLLAMGLSLGIGLLLAALNVEYRDFRYVVPFIVQFGLFVSPIAFTTAVIPERWRTLIALNPMVGIIEGFRWCILRGQPALDVTAQVLAVAVTMFLLLLGVWYFRRMERSFADVI